MMIHFLLPAPKSACFSKFYSLWSSLSPLYCFYNTSAPLGYWIYILSLVLTNRILILFKPKMCYLEICVFPSSFHCWGGHGTQFWLLSKQKSARHLGNLCSPDTGAASSSFSLSPSSCPEYGCEIRGRATTLQPWDQKYEDEDIFTNDVQGRDGKTLL